MRERHPSILNLKHRKGSDSGFTLIEMIVSLVLMSILASILGMGLVAAMQSYDFSRANVRIAQKGQMAMARMARELAELTDVFNAQGDSITYERIQDVANIPTATRLRMHFADNALRYDNSPPDQIINETSTDGVLLANEVNAFSLQYYKGQSLWVMGIDDLALLSTIQITLTLTRPDNPARTQIFTTLVHLRNTHNAGGAAP